MPKFTIQATRTRIVTEQAVDIEIEADTEAAALETAEMLDRDGHLTWHMLFNDPSSGAHQFTVTSKES